MLPLRVAAQTVAVAVTVMGDSPTTRRAAEMLPCRESNLAVAVPSIILRSLRPARYRTIVYKMEVPEYYGVNGSSNREPKERGILGM